jgi:uncharacterized protein
VVEQILNVLPRGIEAMFYRTQTGVEADVVLVQGQRALASVEIKYSSAPQITQGSHIAAEDVQAEQRFVIIPHGEAYPTAKGMTICGLDFFLGEVVQKLG